MQRIRRALNHDHHRSNRAHSSTWLSSGTSPAMVRRSAGSFVHEYILPSAQLTAFARIAPRVRCTTSLSTKWCRTCVWTTRDAAPWCHPTTCAMVSLQVVCVRCERTRCSATRLGDQQWLCRSVSAGVRGVYTNFTHGINACPVPTVVPSAHTGRVGTCASRAELLLLADCQKVSNRVSLGNGRTRPMSRTRRTNDPA